MKKYLNSMKKNDESDLFKSDNYFDLVQFGAGEMIESYWNIFL